MKTLLLLAMLTTGLAPSAASAASELDALRTRCADLQRQVRHLEAENSKLKAAKAGQTPADGQAAAEPSAPAKEAVAAVEGKTHKIQQGETFASIAKKYKVSINSLIAANPTVKPTALRPGQLIRLTAAEPSAAPVPPKSP
ncbi:MAG: LysM peptidoglycan-binding domain-containing protein, partial [Verrucomicrobiota bacterium]